MDKLLKDMCFANKITYLAISFVEIELFLFHKVESVDTGVCYWLTTFITHCIDYERKKLELK